MINQTFLNLHKKLLRLENTEKAKHSLRFFKTGKGEYGEGDQFIGLTTPESQKLVKEFINLPYEEIQKAIDGKYHEERLIGLLILVDRYNKGTDRDKKTCYELFIHNTHRINNWDLVDVTVDKVIGSYLEDKDKKILYTFAKSKLLWERRIAIMSTFYYIKNGNPKETLKIAEILLHDNEDLIHKAVGWMLREIGKRCGQETEEQFLKIHYKTMPRTMLRYAIEHFNEGKRQKYLHGKI
jgi:3-methyladenine DNA glycosylase AlkD